MSFIEENDQTQARRQHLERIAALTGNAYPNRFTRSQVVRPPEPDTITAVFETYKHLAPKTESGERATPEQHEAANRVLNDVHVALAGRLAVPPRVMGKAAFVHLTDGMSRLQIYVRKESTKAVAGGGEDANNSRRELDGWEMFNLLDHGDFIGVRGHLFVTKTGELSVHVDEFEFLAKALVPMPDKIHGIHDPELRARRRYADLIAGSLKVDTDADTHHEDELTPREVFVRRAKLISEMRRYLDERDFTEVETPMLVPIASGAAARPFVTHHNALGIPLYARIAPELYLKRLLVGGFERVYELNRNFRNEGLSTRHNPEFTMLEFYCAYMDVNEMMDFCEAMIKDSVQKVNGSLQVKYGESEIDFSKFERLTMKEAIVSFWQKGRKTINDVTVDENFINDTRSIRWLSTLLKLTFLPELGASQEEQESAGRAHRHHGNELAFEEGILPPPTNSETEENLVFVFSLIENSLTQPTFIVDYPKSMSPLSKASPANPNVAERFELFINGMECANGFSELNDPHEQHERFRDQMKERETGDDEAMMMDEDYIRALSYGMPPAAGIGIGIDRFVMLLTKRRSIRDVILFPHMRPEPPRDEVSE